jgi:release factor H-coupled RctB family protein
LLDTAAWLKVYGVEPTQFDTQSLGTIGGGNHFAELQQVEEIRDQKVFDELGLDIDSLVLLVHSGSRAYGESVLHKHLDAHGPKGLMAESEAATQYLQQHDSAMMWAKANRSLIAHRFLSCLTASPVNPADANVREKIFGLFIYFFLTHVRSLSGHQGLYT